MHSSLPFNIDAKTRPPPSPAQVRVTLAPSAFFDRYTTEFPQLAAAVHAALGRTVALIDGLETVTALRYGLQTAPCVLA